MNINLIKSNERGSTKLPWLESKHTYSFNRYYNPFREKFGALLVVNDDMIDPAKGFMAHPHENMEIITILLKGSLMHEDNIGNKGVINEGDVQRISAGTGIFHSEINNSLIEKTHLLQIWVEPKELGISPSYEQKSFKNIKENEFHLMVSNKNKESIYIHQDAFFSLGNFNQGKKEYIIKKKANGVYLFVVEGEIKIEENILNEGDSAEIKDSEIININILENSKILIVEVPLN
ncbi:MAG: pirin family protein [Nanoarchaeota archaeon]|nr:pirin family protein [Nanoarchaeota archaeon]